MKIKFATFFFILLHGCTANKYDRSIELVKTLMITPFSQIDTLYCDENNITLIQLKDSILINSETHSRQHRQWNIYYYANGQLAALRVMEEESQSRLNPETLVEYVTQTSIIDSAVSFYFNENKTTIAEEDFMPITSCSFQHKNKSGKYHWSLFSAAHGLKLFHKYIDKNDSPINLDYPNASAHYKYRIYRSEPEIPDLTGKYFLRDFYEWNNAIYLFSLNEKGQGMTLWCIDKERKAMNFVKELDSRLWYCFFAGGLRMYCQSTEKESEYSYFEIKEKCPPTIQVIKKQLRHE